MDFKKAINDKDPVCRYKSNTPCLKCFLVSHGEFYGKEILNGIVFIPDQKKSERALLETALPGDIFLHCSSLGISAIGRALCAPYRAPFPHWRCREGKPGERGTIVEVEICLLPEPIPFPGRESSVSLLEGNANPDLLRRISKLLPEIAAEWLGEVWTSREK